MSWGAWTPITEGTENTDSAADPFFHCSGSEVQKQPGATVSHTQVSKQLATMNRRERLERLHFDDDYALDHEVCAIDAVDPDAEIHERETLLCLDREARLDQLEAQPLGARANLEESLLSGDRSAQFLPSREGIKRSEIALWPL
jgi:hypothetical protein